ncbi:MAG TPA: lipid-binding SYLF domain-containing protein [Paracoccaceae bacterium]|nr:lipid-binding SYLF domain-containing protein [Paracoccaceae bacterium]
MNRRELLTAAAALGVAAAIAMPATGRAESREVIETRVRVALDEMYRTVPGARDLAERARAVLVMPHVVKGGFILGGSYGEGALLMNGQGGLSGPAAAYYSVASASVGLQAGVQKSSHALFFMTEDAVERFQRSDGWEIGADAEVTFPDNGITAQTNTTIIDKPVVGVVFGQDGLLLGASLQGAKYSAIVR